MHKFHHTKKLPNLLIQLDITGRIRKILSKILQILVNSKREKLIEKLMIQKFH